MQTNVTLALEHLPPTCFGGMVEEGGGAPVEEMEVAAVRKVEDGDKGRLVVVVGRGDEATTKISCGPYDVAAWTKDLFCILLEVNNIRYFIQLILSSR